MNRDKVKSLSPTKQKFFNKKIFGFDIETADDNKTFLLCSIYGDNGFKKFYYSKEEFKQELKNNEMFRDSFIFATNLSFDFFGTFFNDPNFFTLFRGGDLILAKTYFYNNTFYKEASIKENHLRSLTFIDSMNFAKLSVEKMGKIINISKMEKPSFLGKIPINNDEWDILRDYNLNDSRITMEFMKYIISSFEFLGCTFKSTLASSSLSLFKNKYLKTDYYLQPDDILLEELRSYYGGMTIAFKRGFFESDSSKTYNYYDFNSLYPSVMYDYDYPDPNSFRINHIDSALYFNKYHGISDIEIVIPDNIKYPILPYRTESGKVIFPTGKIRGIYTNIEIREAIKQGGKIVKIYKNIYFIKNCTPFKEFVSDLYFLRNKFKKENNIMEYIVKLLLNSFYGKFGEKWLKRDNWIHNSMITYEDFQKYDKIERKGEYIRIVEDIEPSNHAIPIWASYVTAYGRIKLNHAIQECDPIYCDTDSLITSKNLNHSDKLGDLKLEMTIKRGIVVRPKFYALQYNIDNDLKDYIKIKGLGIHLNYKEFLDFVNNPTATYIKFTKFKESLRMKNLVPNQLRYITKNYNIEDEKRIWINKFDINNLQDSIPLNLQTYLYDEDLIKLSKIKILEYTKKDLTKSIRYLKDNSYLYESKKQYKELKIEIAKNIHKGINPKTIDYHSYLSEDKTLSETLKDEMESARNE